MTLYYTGRVYDIGELTILDLNLFGGLSEARAGEGTPTQARDWLTEE